MKRRFFTLMLVVAMLAMTLVGCGETTDTTDTTNNDTNVETNVETDVEVDAPTDDTVVEDTTDVPVVDDAKDDVVVEDSKEDEKYSDSYSWTFPEGMDGFTDKYVFNGNESWSLNFTHYVDNDGNEMNFLWEGPVALGEQAALNGKTLFLWGENNNYEFSAWTYGYTSEDYAQCIDLPKETWISYADDVVPYEENGFYNVEITDTTIEVTFKVLGNGYEGYNYYIIDTTNEICYQFAYLENIEIYDDTRAMNVINSISYWSEYELEETTNN